MSVEVASFDKCVKICQAACVDADFDSFVESGEPPAHGGAHGDTEGCDSVSIDVIACSEVVDSAKAVVDHHSPHYLTFPEHLLEDFGFGHPASFAESPGVDA